MTLYHHDGRPYIEAATEAAAQARAKMQETIDKGRASAEHTIARVMQDVPQDALIRTHAIELDASNGKVRLGNTDKTLSNHALTQLCQSAGMPGAYARELLAAGSWGEQLLTRNLTDLLRNHDDERKLVRMVGGQVRGILSDSYKRLDSRPLVEAFCGAAQAGGLVPVMGHATETRVALKAMLPAVFEPAPHEVVAFGLEWENSDFGAGAHSCRVFMLRLWCTNFAIAERALRQVHLGRQIEDVAFSQKTYQLEAKHAASALGDIVRAALTPDRVQSYCDVIAAADAQKIDADAEISKLKALTKGERGIVADAYRSADVEMLPPGNTMWRLSNALSWVAQKADGDDRRLELEKLAGDVLPIAKAA
jgi:hypothetical protein